MQSIYINGRFLTQNVTGVQRYARELVKAFDRMIGDGSIDADLYKIVIIAPETDQPCDFVNQIPIKKTESAGGHLWEQTTLPKFARNGILFSPGNVGPVHHKNHIVTIHDTSVLAMPETFSWSFRTWYHFILKSLCRNARHIITVSQFSKSEIIKYFKADPDKISVIYHGVEHCLIDTSPSHILTDHDLEKDSYILAVGSLNLRKNFSVVLEAASHIKKSRLKIVIAGESNPRIFGGANTGVRDKALCLGRVNDIDLAALYENAAAFVFPSLYEGFGLPPLEAMAHGCPVIVSDIPPHHEVCGDAALYFEPDLPEILAEHIDAVISDKNLQAEMSQKSSMQAALFSWDKCSKTTWNLLTKLAQRAI